MLRVLARSVLGLVLTGLALAACSAPQSIRLERMTYAARYVQGGAKGDLTLWWSGNPKLPITVNLMPAPGCSQGPLVCQPGSHTFSGSSDPLVWAQSTFCSGNAPASLPPWRGGYYYWLTDAAGHRSERVLAEETCHFTPVPVAYTTVDLHGQPWLTQVLRPATQISWKVADVGRSLALTLSLVLLIAFPSQLFNSTLQAHYDEVMGRLGRFRPAGRLPSWLRGLTAREGGGSPRLLLAGVFVLGGLMGSLLDPRWGFDRATLEGFLGILVATAFTTAVYTWVHAQYYRRALQLHGRFRIYGGGILVALACLLVSRLTAAEPGYLYGVLLGFTVGAAGSRLARHHQGRQVGLGAAATLLVSVAVWLLWTPVKAAADATDAGPLVVLSTAMAGVFAGGITSLLFGLLPLRWLDGEKLLAWRRLPWAVLVLAGMFLFVHVVLNNAASTPHPGRNLAVTVALFAAFGAVSVGFWAYFRFRAERVAPLPAPA